jgi:PAS domain S-box-containing protein
VDSARDAAQQLRTVRAELQQITNELLRTREALRQREEAESALLTTEARLRLVMRAANIGFWEWDIPSDTVYHSPEWKRQLGYADDELSNAIGEWQSRLHPHDQARVRAVVENFVRSPQPGYDLEFRLRHRDGSYRWIHSQGVLLSDSVGQPTRLIGVHVDVTASKAREAELQQSEQRFRRLVESTRIDVTERKRVAEDRARLAAIVESSNDAILGETLEGIITSWNKGAERMYGYTAQEALGRPVQMLVPRERADEVTEILARMTQGEMVEHFETVRMRKDGRQFPVSLLVSPIRDLLGKIVGASAVARDMTERKQLEAEVLQISEREQQRIARDLHDGLGQLLSGTVHLTSVLQLELAEQALPEAAEALRILELLNQAVGETRSLARGLYPVPKESNGLMSALQDLASRTKELFKIKCTFQCRKPVLIADNSIATHLYRIAQEAVANALKHGHAGRIQIALTATRQRIVLTVRDDGVGLVELQPARKGMGIRIMQYRAGMIDGALSIQPAHPKGLTVVCTVHRHPSPDDLSKS